LHRTKGGHHDHPKAARKGLSGSLGGLLHRSKEASLQRSRDGNGGSERARAAVTFVPPSLAARIMTEV
jgi:hypothetical protein